MSEIGKKVRLNQLFNQKSGNSVMVAMDHAIVVGPIPGIVNPSDTVKLLSKEKPDTFFMPIGAIKQVYPSFIEQKIPFIASIDACTFMSPEADYYMLSDTVEHAMSIGASAVSAHVFVGPQRTSDMLKGIAQVAIDCDRLGMPLLAIMYPWGFENNFDVKYVKWVARIGAELGADLVKTFYTGSKETFSEVIESCPVPVLLSGGDKTSDPKDFLNTLKTCMDCGAHGVAVGRNVWQSDNPAAMLRSVIKIVHENCSVEDAVK
jgi:fructose-bisphosphate aldolase / 2-amino-3,7-dideoxy-D-threo-hept-6-ulosonate synthase